MAYKVEQISRIVTGVFSDSKVAANAMAGLLNAGFPRKSLSVVGADTDEFRELTADLTKKQPDTALVYGTALGAIFGAICGWYAIELMPAAKYLLSMSGLMAAATGAIAGAYMGMICGSLPHFATPQYESNVVSKNQSKGLLISVFVKDTATRIKAENILEKCWRKKYS